MNPEELKTLIESDQQDNLEKLAVETKADLKECREDRDLWHSKFHEFAMQVAQVKRNQ